MTKQTTTTTRPSQTKVDLSKLKSKKQQITQDFTKMGINPKLNALLNLAKEISDEKNAKRHGVPTTDDEKKLYHDIATACLGSTASLETVKAMFNTAYETKQQTELFPGILPSRTPSRFNRELNETFRVLKSEADKKTIEANKSESVAGTDAEIQLETSE